MGITNSDTLTLTIDADGDIAASQDIYAGASYDLVVTGATFVEGRAYRLTVKHPNYLANSPFTVTVTALTLAAGNLTGTLNLNNSALITHADKRNSQIRIELWDDDGDRPVAAYTLDVNSPAQRSDDVPDQTQPQRTYTDDQIDAKDAAIEGAGKPTDTKATPVDADGVTLWDSAASFAGKFVTVLQLWTNYIKVAADLVYAAITHASTHATGGSDPLTPAAIGAQPGDSGATLPTGGDIVTGEVFRLTAADNTAKAPPGLYVHDGTGWTCLSYFAAYDLGNLTGAVGTLTLIPGAKYIAAKTGEITSMDIVLTRTGIASIRTTGAQTVAVPTATGRTVVGYDDTAATAWTDAGAAIAEWTFEDDATYMVIIATALEA